MTGSSSPPAAIREERGAPASSSPSKWLRLLVGNDDGQRVTRCLLLLATAFGLGLRIYNFVVRPPTLWQDEAYWAVKTLQTAAIDAQIRPLGFMLTTQLLLHLLGAAAWVYRLLPFVGSLVSMVLAPYVALRLLRSHWSQLLAVTLLAVSPIALEMAVEFKHYGTEVGVYVALLAAVLSYREKRSWTRLLFLLALAWVAFFFSITVIFAYPALFGFLGWQLWQEKNWRRLSACAGVALLCLSTITTIYFTTWRTIKSDKAENKWGTWYDVFYIENGLRTEYRSRLAWSTDKYFALASVPGVGRERWETARLAPTSLARLKTADLVLWSALHLAGLAWLVRKRRFLELAVLWSPLLFVTAFNLAARWPAGAFRTNTFYVPFAIFIASFGTEWFAELPERRRWLGSCFAALLLLPTLYFRPLLTEKGLFAKPGAFTEALQLLPTEPARNARRLIMDFESCRPWDYYTAYDEPFAEVGRKLRRYRKLCRRTTKDLTRELARQVKTGQASLMLLLTDPRKFAPVTRAAQSSCRKLDVEWVRGQTHLLLRCRIKP